MRKLFITIMLLLSALVFAPDLSDRRTVKEAERQLHDAFLADRSNTYKIDLNVMHFMRITESQNNPNEREFSKDEKTGKYILDENRQKIVISRGYFQLCDGTIIDYCKEKKIIQPSRETRIEMAYNPYWNTEITCWVIAKYLRIFRGDYKAALSAHNMGLTAFLDYRESTGFRFYPPYIAKIRKAGAKNL